MNDCTGTTAPETSAKADVLRFTAAIFEKPRRDPVSGTLHPPTELCRDAATCCRFIADAIDRNDPYLPPAWRR